MIFVCEACRYLFDQDIFPTRCPDCGAHHGPYPVIRAANIDEIRQYREDQKKNQEKEKP